MIAARAIAGIVAAASLAVGVLVAPAFGAPETSARSLGKRTPSSPRSFGSFTPSAADPRLAAVFARAGLDGSDFRFTPSETRRGNRAVTVAVRARTNRTPETAFTAPTVGIAPIAYSLGAAVGWKRFAIQGDVAKVDMVGAPGGREAADVAVSYSLPRFTGRVKAATDRPLAGATRVVEQPENYSVDVGGSYSLTRNLDVTAGLRYRSDRDRLTRLQDDNRRDSQAVYLGTAFRF